MKTTMILCIALLTGCGLTPKQMQALDGALCTKTSGYGISNTTAIVAGSSKSAGTQVNGDTCSIVTIGK